MIRKEGREVLSLKKNTYLKCIVAISFFLLKGIFNVEQTVVGDLSGLSLLGCWLLIWGQVMSWRHGIEPWAAESVWDSFPLSALPPAHSCMCVSVCSLSQVSLFFFKEQTTVIEAVIKNDSCCLLSILYMSSKHR